MYKKIDKLDENTREVFYLRLKGDLSFKEIGEILNKSEEWARVIFYRGKIKLKEDFNNGEQKNCKIVRDLLPGYIEKLLSMESNVFVNECRYCKEIYSTMNKEIEQNTRIQEEKDIDEKNI